MTPLYFRIWITFYNGGEAAMAFLRKKKQLVKYIRPNFQNTCNNTWKLYAQSLVSMGKSAKEINEEFEEWKKEAKLMVHFKKEAGKQGLFS